MRVKNILISQNAPADIDKTPYADLKRKYSINLDFYKFFRLEGVTAREFRDSKVNILDHSAIIFASKNTVDHFFNLVKELRLEIPETMRYFCTTETTAHYLQKYIQFRKRKIFFGKNNTPNGIFDVLLKNRDNKFLVPCSSDSPNNQFTEFFDKQGISYTQAVVFKALPNDLKTDVDITKYDMIVFFSPVGIQSLRYNFPEFEQGDSVAFGALGNAAISAIEAAGWTVQAPAPTKTAPSITTALDIFLKEHATRRR